MPSKFWDSKYNMYNMYDEITHVVIIMKLYNGTLTPEKDPAMPHMKASTPSPHTMPSITLFEAILLVIFCCTKQYFQSSPLKQMNSIIIKAPMRIITMKG